MDCENCGHQLDSDGNHKEHSPSSKTCIEWIGGSYLCGCIKPQPKDVMK